jgi:hypothetical protein
MISCTRAPNSALTGPRHAKRPPAPVPEVGSRPVTWRSRPRYRSRMSWVSPVAGSLMYRSLPAWTWPSMNS